jgi:sugar phosphate permease
MMGDQNRTQLNDDQNDKPTLTETEESKLFFWRVWVFVITFLCYCSLHSMRKAFTNQKANLQDFYGFDKVFLGTLDVIFMFAYAIGLLIR